VSIFIMAATCARDQLYTRKDRDSRRPLVNFLRREKMRNRAVHARFCPFFDSYGKVCILFHANCAKITFQRHFYTANLIKSQPVCRVAILRLSQWRQEC
jgi:hypothetical protein